MDRIKSIAQMIANDQLFSDKNSASEMMGETGSRARSINFAEPIPEGILTDEQAVARTARKEIGNRRGSIDDIANQDMDDLLNLASLGKPKPSNDALSVGMKFLSGMLVGGNTGSEKKKPAQVDPRLKDVLDTEVNSAQQGISPELIKASQEERLRRIAEQELSLQFQPEEITEEAVNSAVEDLKADLIKLRQGK